MNSNHRQTLLDIFRDYGLCKAHGDHEQAITLWNKFDQALTEAQAAAHGAEIVGYRYRHSEGERWQYGPTPENWWECRPMYDGECGAPVKDAPTPTPAAQSARQEAAAHIVTRKDDGQRFLVFSDKIECWRKYPDDFDVSDLFVGSAPQRCAHCRDTGYLADGNHCQWCALPDISGTPPVTETQALWDVYAFNKWSQRVAAPIEWDAHTVYLSLVKAGWSTSIEVRAVSANNCREVAPGLANWLRDTALRHEQSSVAGDPVIQAEIQTLRDWATSLDQARARVYADPEIVKKAEWFDWIEAHSSLDIVDYLLPMVHALKIEPGAQPNSTYQTLGAAIQAEIDSDKEPK